MEYGDRHLEFFSTSMIQYLNEVLIQKNCVSSIFRKHHVKNEEDVEFSFLLKSSIDSSCDDNKSFNQIESSCLTEEELRSLKINSETWCLHLSNILIRESKLYFKLNRPHSFSTIIKSILTSKSDYGKRFSNKQIFINLTSDDVGISDLTEYRSSILKKAAENVLKAAGYELGKGKESEWIHFTTKNWRGKERAGTNILCGPVINSVTKAKETLITTEGYSRLCSKTFQQMSENKNSETDKHFLQSLTSSSIKISLLQVKSSQAVSLNFDPDSAGRRERGSKGGVFFQYNASRLAAIRKKHEKFVSAGIYPEIPRPEDLDFGVLKEPEEWALLFNFLLEYPSLIAKIGQEMASGKANIHQLCHFLSKLCSLFSAYYRRVRILLEPREHLLPIIHARLLLAMSVEQILENGLAIFDIKKIEEM